MLKKLMRGSLLLTIFLVISITLTGCSLDLGKIISGLTNTLGSIVSGIGKVIKSGVEVVKNVVKTVKPAVKSVGEAIGEFTGKTDKIATKIDTGLNKIDTALTKTSNFGQKLEETGEKLKATGKDSAGNSLDMAVQTTQTSASSKKDSDTQTNPTTQKASNSANENSKDNTYITKEGNKIEDLASLINNSLQNNKATKKTTNDSTINTKLLTSKDKENVSSNIKDGCRDLSDALDNLHYLLDSHYISNDRPENNSRAKLMTNLKRYKNELYDIKRNPTSKDSQEKYQQLKTKLESIKTAVVVCGRSYGMVKTQVDNTINDISNGLNKLDEAFIKIE